MSTLACGRWRFDAMRPLQDAPASKSEVRERTRALKAGETILTTGLVLQELLQGFSGPRARQEILGRFSSLPLLIPDRHDHIDAADLRSSCRRTGIQIATIDAILAQLCIRHDLAMLSADNDFANIAACSKLKVWTA